MELEKIVKKKIEDKQKLQRRIKLAHLINNLGPAGKELGILKLVENLNTEVFDTTLIVTNVVNSKGLLDLSPFKIIHLKMGKGNHFNLPLKLAKIFKDADFDLLHTHSWGTLLEGIVGAKIARVPFIIHGEHGTFPMSFPHTHIQKFFWSLADQMLSVSDELRKQLSAITHFPEEKIGVILNGVDERKFYPSQKLRAEFRKKFNFKETDFIVGIVGRLCHVKNQAMLVRAIAHIVRQRIQIEAVLIGDDLNKEKYQNMLENLASELGVTKNIHFLGFNKDVNLILNGIDLFTLTSLSEGCSNVIQEAMFAGRVVIATNVGGNSELVQDNQTGILIESNNERELGEAIKRLMENSSELKRMEENSKEYALKFFSLPQMVKSYEDLYIEAFNNSRASRE
jgi:glycosyltransferase involved in cell wall biosynthesis